MAEWSAFDRVEPFGDPREDLRTGIVTSNLFNAFTGSTTKPADFMPLSDKPEPVVKSVEELKADAMRITAMLGGKIKEAKRGDDRATRRPADR